MNERDKRRLLDKVDLLPERPGVYLFKDAGGQVIYVGKAASLRDRVRSYFRGDRHLSGKALRLAAGIADLEHIVTDTEVEALILECNLIKKHRPRFNIRLRDDKNYPYLRVTVNEPWPRVVIARSMKDDGARYFGPFTRSQAVHETLRVLRRVFPHRTCSDARFRQHRDRPCLHHFIKRCPGPCAGLTTPEAYRETIGQLVAFLGGRRDGLLDDLRRRMEEASERLEFERAAELRDKLLALERVVEKQKIVSDRLADQDVVALARGATGEGAAGALADPAASDPAGADEPEPACVQVFFVRDGKLVGREPFLLTDTAGSGDGEVLAAFLKQYYAGAGFIPPEILLAAEPEDAPAISAWLSQLRGGRVALRVPQRGEKRRLLEMVRQNAVLFLEEERLRRRRQAEASQGTLAELQTALGLPAPPRRIECYDISSIQGRQTVASMVVFQDGRPAKKDYRKFRVWTVEGADDFASMREVLARRFLRAAREGAGPGVEHGASAAAAGDGAAGGATAGAAAGDGAAEGGDESFSRLPDLVIIDGGRGQLSAARRAMATLGFGDIPTFGLAKENEWLFAEGRPDPIILPRDSQALYLLQRVRDEAHRFALGYHRKLRSSQSVRSLLEEIPGIGPKRRKALLTRFRSLGALAGASVEELAAVPGMTRAAAEEVFEHLSRIGKGDS